VEMDFTSDTHHREIFYDDVFLMNKK